MCVVSAWAPGSVAVATVRGVPDVRVFKLAGGDWAHASVTFADDDLAGIFNDISGDDLVTDVRPLVVLDLDGWDVGQLIEALSAPICATIGSRFVADQIEAQTRPPKPPEPQGLGAVVEDSDGQLWVRAGDDGGPNPWCEGIDWEPWDRIRAVRVLSEGVIPC